MRWLALVGLFAACSFEIAASDPSATDGSAPSVDAAACSPACPLGCDLSNQRCLELVPSNMIDPSWLGDGTVPLAPTQDLMIDTDAGTIVVASSNAPVTGVVYRQVAAADCGGGWMVGIGVFSFTTIEIPANVRVRAIGGRALALLASGRTTVDGTIDVQGGGPCTDAPRCAGPGGFAGGLAGNDPQRGDGSGGGGFGYSVGGAGDEGGGGGGGACATGGLGGSAGASYPGGTGGGTYQAAALIPLCGGSGGGAGGPGTHSGDPGGRGGGGGGALQLVSAVSVDLGTTGTIVGAGAGGQGDKVSAVDDGGGGGGAGGAILIEAPAITVASGARIAVNGGGGAGGYNSGQVATDGLPGLVSNLPASGGSGVRPGGAGGAGTTAMGVDAPGPVGDGGAGGGGAGGRIRFNTRAGMLSMAGMVSPAMGMCTTTGVVTTR